MKSEKSLYTYVCTDYPTIPWILYIMVMFKRYSQLLLKMPTLSEESTLYSVIFHENFYHFLYSLLIFSAPGHFWPTKLNIYKSKILHLTKQNSIVIRFVITIIHIIITKVLYVSFKRIEI